MNILIYCNAFLPKQDGIVYRIKSFLDYLLDKSDYNVILISANPNSNDNYNRFKIYKIDSIFLPKGYNNSDRLDIYVSNVFNSDNLHDSFKQIIIEEKIDIIHIYQGDFSVNLFNLIGKNLKIPVVYSWHTDIIHYNKTYLKKKNSNILKIYFSDLLVKSTIYFSGINNCQQILTVSKNSQKRLENYGIVFSPIKLIPIIIDTKMFYPLDNIQKNDIYTILFVGRIDPEKNLDELLGYVNQIDNVKMLLIGDGISKEYLEEKYKSNKFNFMGKVKREELNYYYNKADLFINPSKTETLGFTTLEALATKTNVLAYNAGGTKDIIVHRENGLLYQSKEEFFDNFNLIRLNTDLNQKMQENGIKFCLKHDIPNQCEYLLDLYRTLIKENKNKKNNWLKLKNINKLFTIIIYLGIIVIFKIIGIFN